MTLYLIFRRHVIQIYFKISFIQTFDFSIHFKATAVEVIVWQLDLQLPVQSVPITIKVVGSNPAHVLDTTLCDKDYQWLAVGRRFSLGTPVSSTNKTGRHDIAEILLKVAFNTIILILTATYIHFTFTTHFNLQMVSDVYSFGSRINLCCKAQSKRKKVLCRK